MKRLPKLKIKEGLYLGMRGVNDVYGAPYYSAKEVELYKDAAKKSVSHGKKLESSLKGLISIVEIYNQATENNFARAELEIANEVINEI